MKSDKPKSVAFKGESSLVDLKRKFYGKGRKSKEPIKQKELIMVTVERATCASKCGHTSGFMSRCTKPCK